MERRAHEPSPATLTLDEFWEVGRKYGAVETSPTSFRIEFDCGLGPHHGDWEYHPERLDAYHIDPAGKVMGFHPVVRWYRGVVGLETDVSFYAQHSTRGLAQAESLLQTAFTALFTDR